MFWAKSLARTFFSSGLRNCNSSCSRWLKAPDANSEEGTELMDSVDFALLAVKGEYSQIPEKQLKNSIIPEDEAGDSANLGLSLSFFLTEPAPGFALAVKLSRTFCWSGVNIARYSFSLALRFSIWRVDFIVALLFSKRFCSLASNSFSLKKGKVFSWVRELSFNTCVVTQLLLFLVISIRLVLRVSLCLSGLEASFFSREVSSSCLRVLSSFDPLQLHPLILWRNQHQQITMHQRTLGFRSFLSLFKHLFSLHNFLWSILINLLSPVTHLLPFFQFFSLGFQRIFILFDLAIFFVLFNSLVFHHLLSLFQFPLPLFNLCLTDHVRQLPKQQHVTFLNCSSLISSLSSNCICCVSMRRISFSSFWKHVKIFCSQEKIEKEPASVCPEQVFSPELSSCALQWNSLLWQVLPVLLCKQKDQKNVQRKTLYLSFLLSSSSLILASSKVFFLSSRAFLLSSISFFFRWSSLSMAAFSSSSFCFLSRSSSSFSIWALSACSVAFLSSICLQ